MFDGFTTHETEFGISILGDCKDVLPLIYDNYANVCITDPPYNIGDTNKLCKQNNKIISNKEMWGHFEPSDTNEFLNELRNIFTEVYRVCSGSLVSYYDRFEITVIKNILNDIGYYPKNLVGFIKDNPLPHFRKNGFRSDFELGVFCQKVKGKDTFHFLDQSEMISIDNVTIGNKDTEHPTEKPINPFIKYINIMSNEGDIVLDPFAGSFTTAIAAIRTNRKYFCIEIDEKYFNVGIKRIEKELDQLDFLRH